MKVVECPSVMRTTRFVSSVRKRQCLLKKALVLYDFP